jgi:hypothetical protein
MKPVRSPILAMSLFTMCAFSFAADQPAIRQVSSEGIRHSILICGKLTQLINEKSEVVWQVNESSRDGSVLANGNILFSANNVAKEMTRDMKVVWRYALAKPNKELGTARRLANGNTLVVERGPKPRLLEITKDGNIAVEVPLKPETDNGHMQTRMARKLPNGNYIVPHLLAFKVKEYKPDGTVVNEIKTDLAELGGRAAENWPFTAIRLANGNTVVNLTHGNKTVEFNAKGKVVWRVDNSHVAGRFDDPCGGQRLPNGNTVISSYHQQNPAKVRIFEVNRKKEVVWELFHTGSNAHGIHVISTNGEPLSNARLK